jgi:Cys-tRNA synthase (O-phospho-L-seryl-tRNA:Cys-tRNA synthase)
MSAIAATYGDAVFQAIRREYAPLRNAAKLLARDAGTTPRTAENWLAGTHAPNGEKLVNLMAACPDVAEEVNRLVEERRRARAHEIRRIRHRIAEARGE